MGLRTYVLGTFMGIIPRTVIYALVGVGIGGILDSSGAPSLTGPLTPPIISSLVDLAILLLLPVVYKRVRVRKG